jgi:heme exporter protein A
MPTDLQAGSLEPSTTQPARTLRLTLADVAASYGARTVFRGISLTLDHGEILVISGANGSGKSTLLRLLCGLQKPGSGTISYTWQGQQYAAHQASHLIGWVAPDLALYRELTGLENLRFFAEVRGLSAGDTALEALLERVGLGGRGNDRAASYSSGMMQRLRYAYALLHAPPILLLDEPTVTLDERGAAVVAQLIAEQRQVGMTIIATNDPRELRFGDYVLDLQPVQTV